MLQPQTVPAAGPVGFAGTIGTAGGMSLMQAIHNRHAVRSYTGENLSYETIHALLEAAVHAPTAVHEEPWAFVVIQDKATLQRLSDDAKKAIGEIEHRLHAHGQPAPHSFTPPDDIFYGAPALIVIYGKPMGPFVAADCWLAAENLLLAATAMGLGSCVIGLAVSALNAPEWKTELGVLAGMTAYAPIIVGAPKGETPVSSRKEPEILYWK